MHPPETEIEKNRNDVGATEIITRVHRQEVIRQVDVAPATLAVRLPPSSPAWQEFFAMVVFHDLSLGGRSSG